MYEALICPLLSLLSPPDLQKTPCPQNLTHLNQAQSSQHLPTSPAGKRMHGNQFVSLVEQQERKWMKGYLSESDFKELWKVGLFPCLLFLKWYKGPQVCYTSITPSQQLPTPSHHILQCLSPLLCALEEIKSLELPVLVFWILNCVQSWHFQGPQSCMALEQHWACPWWSFPGPRASKVKDNLF